jgi:hypothetical protein
VGGSYPAPLVAAEEPRGITTVVSPPPPALVALAAPVALVAFVPCASVSEGLIPRNDTVKITDIKLAPMMILVSNCLDIIRN